MVSPASGAPALSTILVEPGCQAEVTDTGDIRITVGAEAPSMVGAQLDPIHLSIFSHRFMSIAGEWLPWCPWPCSRGGGAHWGEVVQARGWQGVQRETTCDPGEGAKGESLLATGWAWALGLHPGSGSVST